MTTEALPRYVLHYCPNPEHIPDFKHFLNVPGVEHVMAETVAKALEVVQTKMGKKEQLVAVVAKGGTTKEENGALLFAKLRAQSTGHGRADVFNILFSHTVSQSPERRLEVMENEDLNCHMVSHVVAHVVDSLTLLAKECSTGDLTCPICQKPNLTELEMWHHLPMFHCNLKKARRNPYSCPKCGAGGSTPLLVHYHDSHAPPGAHTDARQAVNLYSFGLCVIQRKSDKKFLVVQEFCNQGYWLPGGGIDPSEMPAAAAKRECLEEAGVDVELTGILRVEVTPMPHMTRNRYIFFGHPKDDAAVPKTTPDFESLGACWVSCDDVKSGRFRLRGDEPLEWFQYVAKGGPVMPMSMLTTEGAPVEIPK